MYAAEILASRVRSEVLQRVEDKGNIVQRRNANIYSRNCLLKHTIEGKIEGRVEVTERRGIRHKQLLDEVKETRGYSKLTEETPYFTLWKNCFGRGCGLYVTNEWKNVTTPF